MYIISGKKYYGRSGVAPYVVRVGDKAFPVYSKTSAEKMISDLAKANTLKAKGYV